MVNRDPIDSLVESTQRTNVLLGELISSNIRQENEFQVFSKSMKPLGLLLKTAQLILNYTIGGLAKFDKIVLQNSDLNMNASKLLNATEVQNIRVGNIEENLLATFKLSRIGFRDINTDLRESIVLLDQQGGQGAQLIQYMATLTKTGATNKTIEKVAQAIAEVSNNTGTTARAAIASLEATGDLGPLLKAIGIDESYLLGLTEAIKHMPEAQASVVGKFAKQLLDPDDIRKSMLVGGIQFGDELLRALQSGNDPLQIANILQRASGTMAERGSQLLKPFDKSVITLQKGSTTMFGEAAKLAQAAKEAFVVGGLTADKLSQAGDSNITGFQAYERSLTAVANKLDRVAGFSVWTTFQEMSKEGGPIEAINKFLADFITSNKLYDNMEKVIEAAADMSRVVAGIVSLPGISWLIARQKAAEEYDAAMKKLEEQEGRTGYVQSDVHKALEETKRELRLKEAATTGRFDSVEEYQKFADAERRAKMFGFSEGTVNTSDYVTSKLLEGMEALVLLPNVIREEGYIAKGAARRERQMREAKASRNEQGVR